MKRSCLHPGRYDEFKTILTSIEQIQKNLHEFLESKRHICPRLDFLSDDELLSLLGSTNPTEIQFFLPKIFQNISSLDFQQRSETFVVCGMISFENEQMNFLLHQQCQNPMELAILNIENEMKRSHRLLIKEAIYSYRFHQTRIDSMRKNIGMIVIVVHQVWSTWFIEE